MVKLGNIFFFGTIFCCVYLAMWETYMLQQALGFWPIAMIAAIVSGVSVWAFHVYFWRGFAGKGKLALVVLGVLVIPYLIAAAYSAAYLTGILLYGPG